MALSAGLLWVSTPIMLATSATKSLIASGIKLNSKQPWNIRLKQAQIAGG